MLPSGLALAVANEEFIARHIFRSRDIKGNTGEKATPKRQAYMPLYDAKTSSWVISVSRTAMLNDQAAIEQNGLEVGKTSKRVLVAYTCITAAAIRSVACMDRNRKNVGNMNIEADEPPPFHAHLVKYPELIEGENPKLLQMECAQELADRSSLVTWRKLPLEKWENEIGGT